jgi:hypothetical protein
LLWEGSVDLLNVLRTLRRFRWTTLTVATLSVGAIAVLVLAVPTVYQVDAAYVLVNPSVPSDTELATKPDLAAENRNNPYLRFSNQSMVGQVVATRMSSDDVRHDLQAHGISDNYVVSPSGEFGGAGQIVIVSGVGPTPEAASHATDAIVARMNDELRSMQKVYGAVDRYLITLIPLQAPGEAKRVVSGQVRSIIAVGGVGLLVLFAAISVRQAMEARPKDALTAATPPPEPAAAEAARTGLAPNSATLSADSPAPMAGTPPPMEEPPATRPAPVRRIRPAAMRLVGNGTRPLHLADDLQGVSSFQQREAETDEGSHADVIEPRAAQ